MEDVTLADVRDDDLTFQDLNCKVSIGHKTYSPLSIWVHQSNGLVHCEAIAALNSLWPDGNEREWSMYYLTVSQPIPTNDRMHPLPLH
jgi:hypothetical protein